MLFAALIMFVPASPAEPGNPIPGQVLTAAMIDPEIGVPAGEYRIRWRQANRCLEERQPILFDLGFMRLSDRDCETVSATTPPGSRYLWRNDRSWLWIVPVGGGSVALLRRGGCYTRARNVVFGAPRINVERCGEGGGSRNWRIDLVDLPPDQRFRLVNVDGRSGFNLVSYNDCVVTRNGSTNPNTDMLAWSCNGSADQQIELIYFAPLSPELEDKRRFAMDRYYETSGRPRPVARPTSPPAAGVTLSVPLDTNAVLNALRQPKSPQAAGAASINQSAVLSLMPPDGPRAIGLQSGLSLDMGVSTNADDLVLAGPLDRWHVSLPYRFAVEGIKAMQVECLLRDSAGQTIITQRQISHLGGPSAGMLKIGISASSDEANVVTSVQCKVALSGERAGTDWEAWTFPESGAPNGWAVWVREAAKSRWWTGAAFRQDYALRFETELPR